MCSRLPRLKRELCFSQQVLNSYAFDDIDDSELERELWFCAVSAEGLHVLRRRWPRTHTRALFFIANAEGCAFRVTKSIVLQENVRIHAEVMRIRASAPPERFWERPGDFRRVSGRSLGELWGPWLAQGVFGIVLGLLLGASEVHLGELWGPSKG